MFPHFYYVCRCTWASSQYNCFHKRNVIKYIIYIVMLYKRMLYIIHCKCHDTHCKNIISFCKKDLIFNKWGGLNLFTLELHPDKKPFVKWKSFPSSVMLYNIHFLYRAPSVVVKGPQSVQLEPLCSCFRVRSAKKASSAATRTCPINFQFEGRGKDGRNTDGSTVWMDLNIKC